ncbi:MAG: DNA polymerase III subunit beta [Chthonomonadaceae bacterium]|nr:DNA polymerase III subunit beta [Chthonomonadaceae bacterium]
MKATVSRKELADALSIAASASSVRSSNPALQSIKIEAGSGSLTLTGCDSEMWAVATCAANIEEPGAVCVQQRLVSDIVPVLGDDLITIALEGTVAYIRTAQSEWKLLALPADEFPPIPAVKEESRLSLPMGEFRRAVDSVSFAVSDDISRPYLTGVLFQYDGATLTLVATDTHRLAVNRLTRDGIGSPMTAIVPEKALKPIKQLPIAEDETITLQLDQSRLLVDCGSAKTVSQLLTGQYPNWERVVPTEFTRMWTVDRSELIENVKRAMILARDNANRVRFSGQGDKVVISARSDDRGEAKEEVSVISKNGEVEIAFNGRYVIDALQSMPTDGVVAEMTEPSRPAVIRPIEGGQDRFCVVMPMALG